MRRFIDPQIFSTVSAGKARAVCSTDSDKIHATKGSSWKGTPRFGTDSDKIRATKGCSWVSLTGVVPKKMKIEGVHIVMQKMKI